MSAVLGESLAAKTKLSDSRWDAPKNITFWMAFETSEQCAAQFVVKRMKEHNCRANATTPFVSYELCPQGPCL